MILKKVFELMFFSAPIVLLHHIHYLSMIPRAPFKILTLLKFEAFVMISSYMILQWPQVWTTDTSISVIPRCKYRIPLDSPFNQVPVMDVKTRNVMGEVRKNPFDKQKLIKDADYKLAYVTLPPGQVDTERDMDRQGRRRQIQRETC